jgi:hypothetical protein
MPTPLSERLERSWVGRAVISLAVAVLLTCQVATHLPPSALQRAVDRPASRVIRLAASEQTWAVFAPNPRTVSLRLEARITFADGSTDRWTLPEGAAIGANLRFYRWRKWLEHVRADGQRSLWEPTARWIASLFDDGPSPVARVELVRWFHENAISGAQPPWEAYTYFRLDVDEVGA